jgi:hypothetical protein
MPIFPDKKVATERDFSATGKVSVWIGDFDDEIALLDYVEAEDGFGTDFGCVLRDRRELSVEPTPKPLRDLLHGFSSYSQFVDEVVRQVGEDIQARCAVVSYASDYLLLGIVPSPNARLRFIGVASFGENP